MQLLEGKLHCGFVFWRLLTSFFPRLKRPGICRLFTCVLAANKSVVKRAKPLFAKVTCSSPQNYISALRRLNMIRTQRRCQSSFMIIELPLIIFSTLADALS